MKLYRFGRGGVHPKENKGFTADKSVAPITPADTLTLLLRQNIGAPSRAVVKKGDTVSRGQMIAEAGGFVGAPIHSPIYGKVVKIENVRDITGYWAEAVILERNPDDHVAATLYEDIDDDLFLNVVEQLSPEDIIARIGDAGLVGLGGASFPTRVKFTIPEGKRIDTLIINGAECEPYLTCDDRLMRERPADVIRGALLLSLACRSQRIFIGIEVNKPEAVLRMRKAIDDLSGLIERLDRRVEVFGLRTRYPQGSEKHLIQAVTDRIVPAGGLPADVRCVVDNVATAFAALQAVVLQRPLTARIVTVTGPELLSPGNFIVENGTTYRHLIDAAGGVPEGSGKIISGGPMMGKAIVSLDAPVTKGVSGVVVLPDTQSHRRAEQPCIRCSRCVSVCAMGLEPYLLMTLSGLHLQQEAEARGVMNCIECGSCQYICPSYRPLLDSIRLTKSIIRKNQKK
ncbi:MAG: electron transport complex subunit RsxC [Muribaculaceae bacterium]|nr:electron transport complex subunit RsxC [Muribaculaceae bacterium]